MAKHVVWLCMGMSGRDARGQGLGSYARGQGLDLYGFLPSQAVGCEGGGRGMVEEVWW